MSRSRLFLVALILAIWLWPGIAAAQDDTPCEATAMQLPIETLALGDQQEWSYLNLSAAGSWEGNVQQSGLPRGTMGPTISIRVTCSADAELYLQRQADLAAALGKWTKVDARPIGDESIALDFGDGATTLYWRHGPFVGAVFKGVEGTLADMEDLATGIDAMLP